MFRPARTAHFSMNDFGEIEGRGSSRGAVRGGVTHRVGADRKGRGRRPQESPVKLTEERQKVDQADGEHPGRAPKTAGHPFLAPAVVLRCDVRSVPLRSASDRASSQLLRVNTNN